MSAVLGKWKSQIDLAVESGDRYTAHAYRSAVRAMSEEVGRAYRSFHAGSSPRAQIEPEAAYDALSRLSTDASVTRKQDWRSKAVASRLAQINHFARKEDKRLAKRGRELEGARALTPSGPNQAPVASPDVFRDWLINQADMTLACHERARGKNKDLAERALCEHRYCKALFDSGAHEGDPWTASRTIRKALASRTQTSLRPVLRDAHRHLVQVMVDPNLRPAKPSAQSPISKPHLPVPMRSTGTRRQDLVKQVSGGKLLSAEQVDELAYLARLADNQGHLRAWGARASPDARRVLASVTGSTHQWDSIAASPAKSDLNAFEWLLSALESAGYL